MHCNAKRKCKDQVLANIKVTLLIRCTAASQGQQQQQQQQQVMDLGGI